MKAWLNLLPLALLASSCHSIPKADPKDDAQAKTFETRPDACGLYVYRNASFFSASGLELELDGDSLGPTGAGKFRLVWLEPGKHELISRSEEDSELEIEAKPGALLYVWQEVKYGTWTVSSVLHLVPEAQGQQAVRACEMLAPEP